MILGGAVLAGALAAGAPGPPGDRTAAGVLTVLSVLGAMIAVSARDLVVLFAGLEITSLSLLARNGLGRAPAARTALGLAVPWAAARPDPDGHRLPVGGGRRPRLGPAGPGHGTPVSGADGHRGALLLAGLAVRAGTAPFHFWVPESRPAATARGAADRGRGGGAGPGGHRAGWRKPWPPPARTCATCCWAPRS